MNWKEVHAKTKVEHYIVLVFVFKNTRAYILGPSTRRDLFKSGEFLVREVDLRSREVQTSALKSGISILTSIFQRKSREIMKIHGKSWKVENHAKPSKRTQMVLLEVATFIISGVRDQQGVQ